MRLGLSLGMSLKQDLKLALTISMPYTQWSLFTAFQSGIVGPPPFVPPTFEEERFTPRIKIEKGKIGNFARFDHVTRMRLVDEANEVFRFAYTRGEDQKTGIDKFYFKIPLLRNWNIVNDPVELDKIKIRISKAEYERATAMLEAVGEMERIVRAVPYHGLYKSVTAHLKKDHGVGLDKTVLVAVDRGGRIPCIILMHALGFVSMETLKVDQGGRGVDTDRLDEFAREGTLRGKHVLFVDSTVDSGRQIRAIETHFVPRTDLGFQSWSVVGSNESGMSLPHHYNVNWGVDPDTTFEDKPEMMGIDYAPGCCTKVVEKPTVASETIRKVMLSVPEGWIYSAPAIDKQIAEQYKMWCMKQKEVRAKHRKAVAIARSSHKGDIKTWRADRAKTSSAERLERIVTRITSSKEWLRLRAEHGAGSLPVEAVTSVAVPSVAVTFHNVLIVGSGSHQDLPDASAQFVAEALGRHCSFFAGTPAGNPGAVLRAVASNSKVPQPEVRLYQPEFMKHSQGATFAGAPVEYVGPEKDDMRQKMISDAHVVLALGGERGTLREVLIALRAGKPTVVIRGYGPVAEYVIGSKRLSGRSHLTVCANLSEAVEIILTLS